MHWMQTERKKASDCNRFFDYILSWMYEIESKEELSFLLGYYSHLITDAELKRTISDEKRVADCWKLIKAIPELYAKS